MVNLFIHKKKYLWHKKIFKGIQDSNTKIDINKVKLIKHF